MYEQSILSNSVNDFLSQQAELGELQKALTAGYVTDPASLTGGGALRVESLRNELALATEDLSSFRFWNVIGKDKSVQGPIHQFTRQTDIGGDEMVGGYLEGERGESFDPTLVRRILKMKYFSAEARMTLQEQFTKNIVDAEAVANQAAFLQLIRNIQFCMYEGDSTLDGSGAGGGEYVEFDGLQNLITTTTTSSRHVIDMQGEPLNEEVIQQAGEVIREYYGTPNALLGPYPVINAINKQLNAKQAYVVNQITGKGGISSNMYVEEMKTAAGLIKFYDDPKYSLPRECPTAATTTRAPSPAPVSVAGVLATLATNAEWAKEFGAAAGSVTYRVTFGSRFGQSTYAESAAVAIPVANQTDAVRLTVTFPTTLTNVPDWIGVYRGDGTSPTSFRLITRVKYVAGTTQVIDDYNYKMPYTYTAYMGQFDSKIIEFVKFYDAMKIPYAVTEPQMKWAVALGGVLALYVPTKWVKFINVGSYT